MHFQFMRQKRYDRNISENQGGPLWNCPTNPMMSLIYNVTTGVSIDPSRQGAIIYSVATTNEHRVHYGVQSATFTRTVFPGQTAGTYRINGPIPTWRGTQITAAPTSVNSLPTGSSRAAGSLPIPYPPRNASAYYSPPQTKIVSNPSCRTCK